MKRTFTKYPSGYVKASADFKYNDAPLIENIADWGSADWAYYLAEDDESYNNIINAINSGRGKDILSGYADRLYDIALEDEFKRFISGYIKASEDRVKPSTLGFDVSYEEGSDSKYGTYITNYVWENTDSKLVYDAIDHDDVSILKKDNFWWIESRGLSNRAYSALIKEMQRLFPNCKHIT